MKTPAEAYTADIALLSPAEIDAAFERFADANPDPKPGLRTPNAFTFLVSVVLSAQATDASVNRATEPLYKIADTPQQMLDLGLECLQEHIKPIGLYRTKARHIRELSRILAERFGGQVPRTREELMSLPGVGQKTAGVVLNVVFGERTVPVDTHILRISPRIGLSAGTTPEKVEADLLARVPERYMRNAHHWLLLHGRFVCTARKPRCEACLISDLCKRNLRTAIAGAIVPP